MKNTLYSTLVVTGIAFTSLVSPLTAQAQRVVDVSPGVDTEGVSPDAPISGLFEAEDEKSVDADSVTIFVNGEDVTSESTITSNFFSYRPTTPFSSGENSVRVQYQNMMGEQRTVNWTFTVQQPTQALNIESVTHNAESEPLGTGATFLATIKGTPGANAAILLVAEASDQVQTIEAEEVTSGVYVATLNVTPENNLEGGVILGRLQKEERTIHAAASQMANFDTSVESAAAPAVEEESDMDAASEETTAEESGETDVATYPLRPAFLSHQNGDEVDGANGFMLKGQTQPNAMVDIEANAKRQVLGGLVNIGSDDLVNEQVMADENGQFEIMIPAPPVVSSGLRYTIRATATKDEESSKVTEITLMQQ